MAFYILNPRSGAPPQSLVILLHGYGANGQDLLSLGEAWADQLRNTAFVATDAPENCEGMPDGFEGYYQWFSLRDWSIDAMRAGARKVLPWLQQFLKEQSETHNVPMEKIALVGFSQGTMMALFYGLQASPHIAGVLGYSGALLNEKLEMTADIPLCLVHGDADDVVPVAALHEAKTVLEKGGYKLETQVIPRLAHGIDPNGLQTGLTFLKTVL
ncbi:MAG: phospholipase [Alphaproteobacteria bacterium]|nr:phospholipase [Alphaproteobacteria bacterium]